MIDQIVEEPLGGAHREVRRALQNLADAIHNQLQDLSVMNPEELKKDREQKYLNMGDKSLI